MPIANDGPCGGDASLIYRAWEARLSPTMRQSHVAGERMFVDYAGTTLEVIDASTGEVRPAQLFVAALGPYTIRALRPTGRRAGPTGSTRTPSAFTFIGGVLDDGGIRQSAGSGITKACFYEPAVNRSYAEMAAHYNTAIVPARPYRARDELNRNLGDDDPGRRRIEAGVKACQNLPERRCYGAGDEV